MPLRDTSARIEFVLDLAGAAWLVDKLEEGILDWSEECWFVGEQATRILVYKKTEDNVKKIFLFISLSSNRSLVKKMWHFNIGNLFRQPKTREAVKNSEVTSIKNDWSANLHFSPSKQPLRKHLCWIALFPAMLNTREGDDPWNFKSSIGQVMCVLLCMERKIILIVFSKFGLHLMRFGDQFILKMYRVQLTRKL